jgi:hypothetical protein
VGQVRARRRRVHGAQPHGRRGGVELPGLGLRRLEHAAAGAARACVCVCVRACCRWGAAQASSLKSFIDATPAGKFNVIDMSTDGDGEWKMWDKSAFWGANFVWCGSKTG